ncbi:hypothetical protein EYF80_062212 [Liparis tanakae]|uniref:Uncharacterized protein n=1 Tax=Liparis tanakae TaxID=230148 RepID=A0A4Z2EH62_9TELE|nr:hypothetical protein EYF80_062212 [Liparis tanakae]
MSPQFTDEEFQGAWRELDAPQLGGGWEMFVETMGVKIYRLYDKVEEHGEPDRKSSLRRFFHYFNGAVFYGSYIAKCDIFSCLRLSLSCFLCFYTKKKKHNCEIVIFNAVHARRHRYTHLAVNVGNNPDVESGSEIFSIPFLCFVLFINYILGDKKIIYIYTY